MTDLFRIAVVDDDEAVRDSASLVLESEGRGIESFPDAEHFLAAWQDGGQWDLVFLDLKMPGQSGFDVLRALSEAEGKPPFPVLMVSAHGDVAAAVQAMRLGAFGFVEKPFTPDDLEGAIEDVQGALEDRDAQREELLGKLTPREREVAECLDQGMTNKEIARELDCSPRTIEIHRARVFEKLSVRNVAGLVRALSAR